MGLWILRAGFRNSAASSPPSCLSDVAFSKTPNEWKQILFGEFCYTLQQGWLQNQVWGSLLMLMIIIITVVSLANMHSLSQVSLIIS